MVKRVKRKPKKIKVKQWFCNRLGVISTDEYDESFADIMDLIDVHSTLLEEAHSLFKQLNNYVIRQDSFNRMMNEKLGLDLKIPKKDFKKDVNYG